MPSEKRTEKKQEHQTDENKESTYGQSDVDGVVEQGEELKEDLDKLLDEIDEVLEEDSEEFVDNYIQRGGQ